MSWCPKCKNEYRPGVLQCAECKIPLVESLDEVMEQEERESDSGMPGEAAQMTDLSAENGDETQRETPKVRYQPYQKSVDKAQDNKSSAYTLFIVGGIGLIADILVFTGVLPLYQDSSYTKYLVCGVMGAMFILFLVFGGVSMRNSRILMLKADTEDSLQNEIAKWCAENLTAELIDEGIQLQDMPEEQKYFGRVDKMKSLISDKFLNLDEAFLDHFVDDYYRKLFEEE